MDELIELRFKLHVRVKTKQNEEKDFHTEAPYYLGILSYWVVVWVAWKR
jgi:hypothetical protein